MLPALLTMESEFVGPSVSFGLRRLHLNPGPGAYLLVLYTVEFLSVSEPWFLICKTST